MSTIAYDIEVAGDRWEEIDDATRDYLLGRARSDEDREAVPERTALFPGLGKVIAIGMWNQEKGRGLCLLEGERAEQIEWDRVPDSDVFRGSEAELLERFWDIVERKRPRLVSYNGRGFDGPVLMIRSAMLGVKPSLNLCGNRYQLGSHTDLMEVFSFLGASRDRYSLDYWCRRFGIESPKQGLDGSQVTGAYHDGRIEEIGEYCLRDVRATGELFGKLADTLIPLFR